MHSNHRHLLVATLAIATLIPVPASAAGDPSTGERRTIVEHECAARPATKRCLLARRFGEAGLTALDRAVLARDAGQGADVAALGRQAGLSTREAALLVLYLDMEDLYEQEWVPVGASSATSEAALVAATAKNEEVRALFEAGRIAEAIAAEREVLAVRERILGATHPDTAEARNNLGFLLSEAGELLDARPLLERALADRRAHLPAEHPAIANSLNNLGSLDRHQGLLDEAVAHTREAIARYERVMGPRHTMTATARNNLATALADRGDLDEAARELDGALAVFRTLVGPRDAKMAILLGNLGHLRHSMGDLAAALDLYRQARDIAVEALGARHPYTAVTLNNLAAAQMAAGQISDGEAGYALAARIWADVAGPDHPSTLTAEINHAEALRRDGRLEAARAAWEALLPRVEGALGADHSTTAGLLNNLGAVTDQLGDHEAASALLRRAVSARQAQLGATHWLTALTETNLAVARWSAGDLSGAKALQASAMDSLRRHFEANVNGADSDLAILDFLRSVRAPFDASLALWSGEREAREAFAQVLSWLGAATRAEALWRDLGRLEQAAIGEVARDLQRWRRIRRDRLRDPNSPPPKILDVVEERLNETLPEFARRRERVDATVDAVCGQLKRRRATLVDYVAFDRLDVTAKDDPETRHVDERYTSEYVAFVVDGRCRVRRVTLGDQAGIDAKVAALQGALDAAIDCLGKRGVAFCGRRLAAADEAGAAVRDAVWTPLKLTTATGHRVWVVPDGQLVGVSFATLPVAAGRYLLEDAEIGYLPYPAALLAKPRDTGTSGAWIGGDVNYRRADAPPDGATSTLRGGTAVCGYGARWPDLTPTEVTPIAAELKGALGDATLVTGAAVTEAAARMAMPGKRVIHLATHGFFSPASSCNESRLPPEQALDPLRLSAVVLAGADDALSATSPASDGILSAREVVDLDLRGTEIVTLSACETGRGTETAGEGVQGLGRAFLVAGSKAVIVSLWRVPSDETGQLFERFYQRAFEKRRTVSVPAALRTAQLSLLADLRSDGVAHSAPLWGAFIPIVGAAR